MRIWSGSFDPIWNWKKKNRGNEDYHQRMPDTQLGALSAMRRLIREQTHEAWGWAPFERLWQDVRFAFRQFSKSPRFALVCVITLALGIGAQTTIYSVVHAVLINPYPYRGAMRMVHLHLYDKDPDPYDLALDGPQFAEFAKSPVLDGAVAEDVYTMALTGAEFAGATSGWPHVAERIRLLRCSGLARARSLALRTVIKWPSSATPFGSRTLPVAQRNRPVIATGSAGLRDHRRDAATVCVDG